MAFIKVDDVLTRYPDAVREVMANLRKGRSKNRLVTDPTALQWDISYCVKVDGNPIKYGDVEGRVADLVANTSATLVGRIERWRGSSESLPEVPDEVVRLHRMRVEEDEAERRRFAALPPKEQFEAQAKILRQLIGTPGFMAFASLRIVGKDE